MTDGRLDLTYLPCSSGLAALASVAACRLRISDALPGVIRTRGRNITVRAEGRGSVYQADGEAGGPSDSNAAELKLHAEAGAMEFLLPARRGRGD